jgi:hypothetical protein
MVLDVGVDEDRVGVKLVERLIKIGEEELWGEMELRCVFGYERRIGLNDANQLDILVLRERAEEPARVIVDQASDDHAHGLTGRNGAKRAAAEKRKSNDQSRGE